MTIREGVFQLAYCRKLLSYAHRVYGSDSKIAISPNASISVISVFCN